MSRIPFTRPTRIRRGRSAGALAVVAVAFVSVAGCSATSDTVATGEGGATANPPVSLAGAVNDHGEKDISADGAAPTLDMELDDSYFGPTYVKAAPGAVVTVKLENEGSKTHTFTLDDTSVDVKVDPGKDAQVQVTMPASGDLHFFCQIHSGAGMQGSFVVSGSGAGGAAPTTAASPTTVATTAYEPSGNGY